MSKRFCPCSSADVASSALVSPGGWMNGLTNPKGGTGESWQCYQVLFLSRNFPNVLSIVNSMSLTSDTQTIRRWAQPRSWSQLLTVICERSREQKVSRETFVGFSHYSYIFSHSSIFSWKSEWWQEVRVAKTELEVPGVLVLRSLQHSFLTGAVTKRG